jgi:hypothetical protein
VSAQGLATIVGRDERYQVCGRAHGFHDAGELIRKHQPDVLLIEGSLKIEMGFAEPLIALQHWIEFTKFCGTPGKLAKEITGLEVLDNFC